MRFLGNIALTLWPVAFAACGGSSGPVQPTKGAYRLELFAYRAEAGRRLELKVKLRDGETTLGTWSGFVRPDGTQSIVVLDVLESGKEYRVDYYVDLDGSGAYTRPTGTRFDDPSWRRFVPGDSTGVNDSAVHDDRWVDISPF